MLFAESSGTCCGASPRVSLFECFDRGLKTRRLPPLAGHQAAPVRLSGLRAQFSFEVDGRVLSDLRFECSACTTLIACCQALVELAKGQDMADLHSWDATRILQHLKGIPLAKHDRVWLAICAFRAIPDSFYSSHSQDIAS